MERMRRAMREAEQALTLAEVEYLQAPSLATAQAQKAAALVLVDARMSYYRALATVTRSVEARP